MNSPILSLLGNEASHSINGLKGVAYYMAGFMNGCIRVGIFPTQLKDDGTSHRTSFFDVQQVIFGVHKILPVPMLVPSIFNFGDEVRCVINGFKGIVTCITYGMDGRVEVGISPTILHNGSPIPEEGFDINQCEIIKKTETDYPNPFKSYVLSSVNCPWIVKDSSIPDATGGPQHDSFIERRFLNRK